MGVPLNPDGSCTFTGVIAPFGSPTTEINRYSGVLGAWYRKGTALHANLDLQFGGADNWIYRIDPTSSFNIRGNVAYAPRSWLTFNGNLQLQHSKNSDGDIAFNQHNYTVMVDATMMPNPHWGLDIAYNFDAIQQNTNVCFCQQCSPGKFVYLRRRPHAAGDLRLLRDPHAIRILRTEPDARPALEHSNWDTALSTTRAARPSSIRCCPWAASLYVPVAASGGCGRSSIRT